MSHLRRVLALIMLAQLGWLVAFGAVGAVSAAASMESPTPALSSKSLCC